MTYPAYFFNVIDDGTGPKVRIYEQATATERMVPIGKDAPIQKPQIAKLIHDLADYIA